MVRFVSYSRLGDGITLEMLLYLSLVVRLSKWIEGLRDSDIPTLVQSPHLMIWRVNL